MQFHFQKAIHWSRLQAQGNCQLRFRFCWTEASGRGASAAAPDLSFHCIVRAQEYPRGTGFQGQGGCRQEGRRCQGCKGQEGCKTQRRYREGVLETKEASCQSLQILIPWRTPSLVDQHTTPVKTEPERIVLWGPRVDVPEGMLVGDRFFIHCT